MDWVGDFVGGKFLDEIMLHRVISTGIPYDPLHLFCQSSAKRQVGSLLHQVKGTSGFVQQGIGVVDD